MMKQDDLPYAVYTQERIETGRPPMIVWGQSEKSVSNRFYKRFGVSAVKIFPAYFDEIEGKWVENREEITMNTEEKLNRLAEMRAAVDTIRLHYEDLRKQVIPPEIQQLLDEIDAEAQTALSAASDGIGNLEAEIKADVIQVGATIKGSSLMAVWNKGRVTWDTKGIEGFAVAHPEINTFRKEGDPSVTIRAK